MDGQASRTGFEQGKLWNEDDIEDDSANETVPFPEYSITSFGVDFDVGGIVRRLKEGDVEIPSFQRGYVWKRPQASRFVESLLMGLPVPGVFLYREESSEKLTVIDGQQRMRTLECFYDGVFVDGKPFNLQGLESRFNDLNYEDLEEDTRRKLNNSIIHATVMKQDIPGDDGSSKYFVFERLNTGATQLDPQEIRAAIYGGEFNKLLEEMNENNSWRKLFGNRSPRKRDEELLLRFLALFYSFKAYQPSMTHFLNVYMKQNQDLRRKSKEDILKVFSPTVDTILNNIGEKAFRPKRVVNAAVLDAVMVGVAHRLQKGEIQDSLECIHKTLLDDERFQNSVTGGTSRSDKVNQRITLSISAFADAK